MSDQQKEFESVLEEMRSNRENYIGGFSKDDAICLDGYFSRSDLVKLALAWPSAYGWQQIKAKIAQWVSG